MAENFEELVVLLTNSSESDDVLEKITYILQQQYGDDNCFLTAFVTQRFTSLVCLENWAWHFFTCYTHKPHIVELLHTLALFNKAVIFHQDPIDFHMKASLLTPQNLDEVIEIFRVIDQCDDDNHPLIDMINLWLENTSHFLHDHPFLDQSAVMDHLDRFIVDHYVVSAQYRAYLYQLRQAHPPPSMFTARLRFYLSTCSYYTYGNFSAKAPRLSYTAVDLLNILSKDYLAIVQIHSKTVSTWNRELLDCLAHVIGLVGVCCWWDGQNKNHMAIPFPTELIACEHMEDLIRIISHPSIYEQSKSERINDETMLMDSILLVILLVIQSYSLSWFFRANTALQDSIISISGTTPNKSIGVCSYAILGELLTDDEMKTMKVDETLSRFFVTMLDEAWHEKSKTYKLIPIDYLLRSKFILLSIREFLAIEGN
jgi:hypothetical protein